MPLIQLTSPPHLPPSLLTWSVLALLLQHLSPPTAFPPLITCPRMSVLLTPLCSPTGQSLSCPLTRVGLWSRLIWMLTLRPP